MALGAAQAIEAAGGKVGEDIYLLGVDALADALEMIMDGTITGTVFNNHIIQAEKTAEAAEKFFNGESVEVKYTLDYVKVTKENAQEITNMITAD